MTAKSDRKHENVDFKDKTMVKYKLPPDVPSLLLKLARGGSGEGGGSQFPLNFGSKLNPVHGASLLRSIDQVFSRQQWRVIEINQI